MSDEVRKFTAFPAIHIDPDMINNLSNGSLNDLPDNVRDLELAKIDIMKQIWEKLLLDSTMLLRAVCEISDDHRVTTVGAAREGLLTGLVFGYALGCQFPFTPESEQKFNEAVAKLMDRRVNGCDDPNCLACQLKRAVNGQRKKKTEEQKVM